MNAKINTSSNQTSSSLNDVGARGQVFSSPSASSCNVDDGESTKDIGSVLEGFQLHEIHDADPYIDDDQCAPLINTAEGVLNGTTHQLLPNLRIAFEDSQKVVRVDLQENNFLMDWHYPGRNNVRGVLPDLDFAELEKTEHPDQLRGAPEREYDDKARRDEMMVRNYMAQTVRRNEMISKGIFASKASVAAQVDA